MVDVMTLGEYPTSIRAVRLIDAISAMTIWEIEAATTVPQIRSFSLRVGENPVSVGDRLILKALNEGSYQVLMPDQAETFWLEADRRYAIQVCGEVDLWCPKRTFTIRE